MPAPNPQGFHLQFASDNTAGACPQAMAAFVAANAGFAPSYGNDDWTRAVCDRLRALFETDCEVFFVFNGTAANSLALAALCQLDDDQWLRHAGHANAMARRLAGRIADIAGAKMLSPTEANGVFVNLPAPAIDALRAAGWVFYAFIGGGARFMCSWATQEAAVDALAADLARALDAV